MNGSEAACHGLTVFGKEIIWCYLFTEDNENCLLKIFGGSDTFRSQIATAKHSSLTTGRRVSNNIPPSNIYINMGNVVLFNVIIS